MIGLARSRFAAIPLRVRTGLALALWNGSLPGRDSCSPRDRGKTAQVPASLRNRSGPNGFVRILGPLSPHAPAPALRFLPALS